MLVSKPMGLIVNGPNVFLRKFNINLDDILNAVKSLGRIIIGKVILNHNAPAKLVEVVINSGLEPVIVNGRVDVAFTVEAMKLIYNPKIQVLALSATFCRASLNSPAGPTITTSLPTLFASIRIGKK